MTVPDWWNERRYGLFVHANIATVPSFAPIGESADRYWSHLGADVSIDPQAHPSPMAEVLAYHRDRWSHVERYDDFIPFLSFHRFDADEQVELALQAGMNYLVHAAKHRDGFCWWEAPGTERRSTSIGPLRDVLAEVAASCRRNGVLFGTAYSTTDWSNPYGHDGSHVDDVVTAQVLDLVERYGTSVLWSDEFPKVSGPASSRIEQLLDAAVDLADAQRVELIFNDRWGHPEPAFTTVESVPTAIESRPWEMHRPLGSSLVHNRAERPEHLLSTGALLDLLSEVVAKGGNLLIDVGLSVDGTIADIYKRSLRAVGDWVNNHSDVIHRSSPFDHWGDAQVRYVRVDADVVALDLAAGSEIVLGELTPDRYDVTSIEADDGGSLHWEQHRGGVSLTRIDRSPAGLAGVYRVRLHPAAEAIRLFEERDAPPKPLQRLLDEARLGDVIQLREGLYQGPIEVPDGVTVRGLGWDRSMVTTHTAAPDANALIASLGIGARLENVHLAGSAILGANAAMAGCRCDGPIEILGDDVTVSSVIASAVVGIAGSDRTTVERCALKGARSSAGVDIGIDLTGGSGHRIHRNEVVDHLCGVRLANVSASIVSENRFESRWWGVHLRRCDHVEVVDNNMQHTMRAVDVDGGNGSIVTGNWVADGDSAAVVEFGATETSVIDNHVERCRIGVLVWDAPTTRLGPNTFVDLHEEDPIVHGPDLDSDLD